MQSGFLGTGPVHMESYYCYELSAAGYSGALLGDKSHWVRKLPGKLLHNIISHGMARIAEFVGRRSTDYDRGGLYQQLSQESRRDGDRSTNSG